MDKKWPATLHVRLSPHYRSHIAKRCRQLNKDILDPADKWTPSKFIRMLIRREMKEEPLSNDTPLPIQTQTKHDEQQGHSERADEPRDYYSDLLSLGGYNK